MNGIYDEISGAVGDVYGSETSNEVTRTICQIIARRLTTLGENFTKNGYPACGRALKLEADTILAD